MTTRRYFRVSVQALSALVATTTRSCWRTAPKSGFPPKTTLFVFLALCAEIEQRESERLVEAKWCDFSSVTITCTPGALLRHVLRTGAKATGAQRERNERALAALATLDLCFGYEVRPAYGQPGPRSLVNHCYPVVERKGATITLHAWPTEGARFFVLVDFQLIKLAPSLSETATRLLCLLVILQRGSRGRGVWEVSLHEQRLRRAGIVRTSKRSDDLVRVRVAAEQLASLGVLKVLSDEPLTVRLSPSFFFHRSVAA